MTRRAARVSAIGATLALSAALVGCSGGSSDDATTPTGGTNTTAGNDIRTTEPEGSTGDSSGESSEGASDGATSEGATGESGGSAGESGSEYDDVNKVDLADHKFELSWQDALDKARGEFKGDVTKIELEVEGNRYGYKIELMSDTQKFEYEIDANTGDVLEKDTDDLSKDKVKSERKKNGFDPAKTVALEDAMKTAQGEQEGRVKEWKVEGKSSGPRFEFDIERPDGSGDAEVKVDAKSGEIIRTGD